MFLRTVRLALSVSMAICALLAPRHVWAQTESGTAGISGVVQDPQRLPVAGALVIIRQTDTGYRRTVTADAQGRYAASALPVGTYTVEAQWDGLAPALREKVSLRVGGTETINLQLGMPGVKAEVEVSAVVSADTTSAASSSRIGLAAVAGLPIRGRNFTEFVQLTPAVVQESDRFGLVISGQRSINSNVSIDGGDFNDPLQGNQRGGNESAFFFPQTAVREFQVVRSGAGAEVGRTGAGFVNVVTKSGTNALHGEGFYYARNRNLTSADAFGRRLNNQQNEFGASMGGPLRQDRAFYFAAVEQNFLRVPFVVKFQDQAAGVVVPDSLKALEGEQRGTNNPTSIFWRTDVHLSSRHTLNVHYTYSRLHGENFNFDSPQLDTAATANFSRQTKSHAVKVGLVSVMSGRMVNDARAQVATDNRLEQPNSMQPQIVISGFGTLGGDTGRPRLFDSTRYQVADTMTATLGRHQVNFGLDVNITAARQERESNTLGRYDFSSLTDYVNGKINRYRQTLPGFDPAELIYRGTQKELALFIHDQIRLASNVTLSAGLRWEGQWNPQPTRPNPAYPVTALIPNDLKMWQPRTGLTWDISGTGRTILRLSAGMYDARTPANLFQRVFTDNGMSAIVVDSKTDPTILAALTFPNVLPALPAGTKLPPQRIFGFDPAFKNPRSLQTAVTLEQRLRGDVALTVGYQRSTTHNLQRRLDRNLFEPTIDAAGTPIFPKTRPDPTIAQLEVNESTAHSQYDAMTLSLSRAGSRMSWAANYTLAKNMDDDSNERNFSREITLNPFNLAAEWAPSKQDVRHTFTANTLVQLPAGFSVAGILMARSGFPFTAVIGSDQQNDSNDDNDQAIIDGKIAGRNTFRQPNFFNLDLRVAKTVRAGRRELQFTMDILNATSASNRNYGNDSISAYGTVAKPVATAGQALFAPSTARFGGPRQVQLGMKVIF